jgi:tetratricopeptide (TPR) repeat protein
MRMIAKLVSLAVVSTLLVFPLTAQNASVGGTTGGASTEVRANAAFMAKDFKSAAELYADLLEDQPLNGKAWFNLGFAQNMMGEFAKSSTSFEKAYTAGFMPIISMYNAACGYSRVGDKAKALFWLQKIADSGYRDVNQLLNDKDLDNIRSEPKYAQIMGQIKGNATPCEKKAEHHQFDFWVGEWQVVAPGGQPVGNSRIERAVDQCAIVENWWGATGSNGKSINLYNSATKKWQQFWVDNSGTSTLYVGEKVGNEMRFTADSYSREGKPVKRKMTFIPMDADRVRQVGESSADEGKTWKVEYDLTYVRKKS